MKPVQWFIFWSTEHARELVRKALTPHSTLGLQSKDIYSTVHRQFPAEKQQLVPPNPPSNITHPPHPEHPIRSMRYLKGVVLKEMESSGELQQVFIRKSPSKNTNEQGERLDAVKFGGLPPQLMVTDIGTAAMQWRWRLVPDFVPNYSDDPKAEDQFAQRRLVANGAHRALRGLDRRPPREIRPDSEKYNKP